MAIGRFLLCLHSHMPYVLSHGKSPHGTDWINESTAECYLPLLHALDRLLNEGIRPRWTINMTPVLAEQLDDPSFKAGFEDYCQSKIDFALEDQRRFEVEGPMWMQGVAAMWQRYYTRALVQFKHQWGRSVNGAFKFFQEQGSVELITSCATHGYMPLLGTDESCQAQVKLGVESYKARYGKQPRGIWLPECAYRPHYDWKSPVGESELAWARKGVEEYLAENGIEYFFVDSHMIRGGQPLGTYAEKFPQLAEMFARSSEFFTPPEEFRSEYEHYMLPNGVVCFARDPQTTVKVWSGDTGYPGDEHYLEFHKQLYPGRLRYWRISQEKSDLGAKQPYDPWKAYERIHDHAQDMIVTLKGTLARYAGQAGRMGTLVAMYDTELFGHWWWEGPEFLFEVSRLMHHDPDLRAVSGGELLDEEPPRHSITLPEGSWGEGGYHYVWLNDGNMWTWDRLYPAQRRMRELARMVVEGERSSPEVRRLVEQAARELLMAEASDWQFLISTFAARDYAEIRFADHVERFERLANLAEAVASGRALTQEELEFLEDCEDKDAAFQEFDLAWWARLEHPLQEAATQRTK
jgi:1,4-alpha-glucan branching enzyme